MYYFHKLTIFFLKRKNIYLPHHTIFLCDAYVFMKKKRKEESFFSSSRNANLQNFSQWKLCSYNMQYTYLCIFKVNKKIQHIVIIYHLLFFLTHQKNEDEEKMPPPEVPMPPSLRKSKFNKTTAVTAAPTSITEGNFYGFLFWIMHPTTQLGALSKCFGTTYLL